MGEGKFDPKLIPEFDVSERGPTIVEWFEKAEIACDLCSLKNIASVLSLRLTRGAFPVFHQFSKEERKYAGHIRVPL